MGRRKPTNVQRKRPHVVAAAAAADGEYNSDVSDEYAANELHIDARATKRQKDASSHDSTARIWSRVMLDDDATPLQLTFRDAWTPSYRSDALWLEARMHSLLPRASHVGINATLCMALETLTGRSVSAAAAQQHSRDSSHGSDSDSSNMCTIGIELVGPTGSISLRKARGETVATALTLSDLFPRTDAAWRAHVVHLVANELLLLELTMQPHAPFDWIWRFGIAWRTFNKHHVHLHNDRLLAPVRSSVSNHRSMHVVMLWLLATVRDADAVDSSDDNDRVSAAATATQCTYAYWDEIDALLAHANGTTDKPNAATAFDIHDVYARIDSTRQLQRDTHNVDALLDSSDGRSALLPTLRPYQRAAVSWMLARETPAPPQCRSAAAVSTATLVHFPSARCDVDATSNATLLSQQTLTYDPFGARFVVVDVSSMDTTHDLSGRRTAWLDPSIVRGGILADEMGLGKTVEVIALVLCHPWPNPRPQLLTHHDALDDDEENDEDASHVFACICGSSDDDASGWVQCDFCHTWHHQLCSGYRTSSDAATNEPFDVVDTAEEDATQSRNAFTPGMFLCFECQPVQMPLFACKTTLIVSPEAIHDQWETELRRHVRPGALSLLRYAGVKATRAHLVASIGTRPSAEWQVLATGGLTMASFDVVLTTYEVLSSDLYHVPSAALHARRASTRQRRKQYAFVGSPLLFLRFWRVCMDEAQVGVENARLRAALTLARVQSSMQWVVTGTPFSTSVRDLFGCFKFLRLAPFDSEDDNSDVSHTTRSGGSDLQLFRALIETSAARGATARVFDLLLSDGDIHNRRSDGGGLLWRTSKRDVLAQLELPEQTTELVWCHFSAVERHYYDERERAIVAAVRAHARDARQQREQTHAGDDDDVGDVTDKVWNDLLVLRQICCHPQVGRAFTTYNSNSNGLSEERLVGTNAHRVLSMDAFLDELVAKCKRECEEAQRQFLAAQNGLAALHVATHDTRAAVLAYLASMHVIETNWPLFRADLLPRLHMLENLARCARSVFDIAPTNDAVSSDDDAGGGGSNPKENSLLPALPALTRAITADDSSVHDNDSTSTLATTDDHAAIARECSALDACARSIRLFYLLQVDAAHDVAWRAFETATQTVDDHSAAAASNSRSKRVLCSSSLWWLSALAALDTEVRAATFTDRVRARLLALGTPWATRFCRQFSTLAGFRVVLLSELEELATKRTRVYAALHKLSARTPSREDVERSGNCRKCRDARDGPVCVHCTLYRDLEALRLHVLGIDSTEASSQQQQQTTARSSRGTQRRFITAGVYDMDMEDDTNGASASSTMATTSLLLEIFRELASCTRSRIPVDDAPSSSLSTTSSTALSTQEALADESAFWSLVQREWIAAKKLLQAQHQRLGALDELEMATLQLRIRLENEAVTSRAEQLYKIEAHDVPAKFASFESDRVVSELELRAHLSRLRFLLQIGSQQQQAHGAHGDAKAIMTGAQSNTVADTAPSSRSTNTCAVCLEDMADERVMLRCAHTFCTSCVQSLKRTASLHAASPANSPLRCPTCRRVCRAVDIVVVRASASSPLAAAATSAMPVTTASSSRTRRPPADAHITLAHGGFGSKLDAIVRRVLALAQRDPHVKCLLFTQWPHMLNIVASHLQRHGVACFAYSTKRAFQRDVVQFKRFDAPCVLALPFKVGANGLNLVEATEVLLVEPLLNTSIEAQAINRVHRIGQTQRTRVHRLVVDSSIEERIYWLGHNRRRASTTRQERRPVQVDCGADAAVASDANADDELVAAERAPTKKERERLTLGDLHVLLDGRAGSVSAGNSQDGSSEDGDDVSDRHPFWRERVVLNGTIQSRMRAKAFIERRYAAQHRADSERESAASEPHTQLFGHELSLPVANEVAHLPTATAMDQSLPSSLSVQSTVSNELLAMHRARLREELSAWRSAASDQTL